jgi:hypothetical protein
MIESFPGLFPIRTVEDLRAVMTLANGEQHDAIAPTDAVKKDGKVVGYASLGGIPFGIYHFSKEMTARESFAIINTAENLLQKSGAKAYITPIGKESTFHEIFQNPKLGYEFLATVDLFVKEF